MERVETSELRGVSSAGRSGGGFADPVVQTLAIAVVGSLVFAAFPGLDLWFSGLFARSATGFPLIRVPAFTVLSQVGPVAVGIALIAIFAAIGWKLVYPDRPTVLPAGGIAFALASLAAISGLTQLLMLAADGKRSPPWGVNAFGGVDGFAGLWHQGGMCSTDCAAFSFGTAWAVWLVGLAVLFPLAWRTTAFRGLMVLAAVMVLTVLARGEEYLSGVLLSLSFSALVALVVYRFTAERPVSPRLAEGRIEADLTRLGRAIHRILSEADWHGVSRNAQSPWLNRRAEFSPLKATAFVLTVLPGAWLAWLAITGGLTPLPWVFLIYTTGIWALWLFLASLAVTPARQIFGWSELIAVRRMLGLGGLAYTVLHILDYVWLDRFSLGFIINEYETRLTVWVATLATAGIFILGATSLDAAIRRMGSAAWTQLHYLAYPAIGLAAIHFDMSPASLGGPMYLITGMYLWLMAWRVLQHYRLGNRPLVLTGLALAAPLASFTFELAWLALYQGISADKTLGFTLDISDGLEPTWQLLIVGLCVAVLAAIFGRQSESRARLTFRPRPPMHSSHRWPVVAVAATQFLAAPIRDRAGRFSPLKTSTLAVLLLPGAWFAGLALTGGLTPQPNGFVIYNSGVWAMWLLLFSLAVTPARHILRWNGLIAVRRMVGLAGLAYTLFHAAVYFGLEKTTLATVSADLQRLTVIVAILSALGLVALAATSFDAAVRRLGSRDWNRIHDLAYPAIGLAMLHYDLGPESLGGTPFVMTGLYFWLMGWRGLRRAGYGADAVALVMLALASGLASFVFEAGWLQLVRGFSAADLAGQLWSLDAGLAETWQVLLVGLAAAGLAAVFNGTRRAARNGRPVAQLRTLQTT